MSSYISLEGSETPIHAWTRGVPVDPGAEQQLRNVAALPIVGPHLAVMPDVHWGRGATIGSVIPTRKAIIPAAVGVDIGCGMIAVRTNVRAKRLPDNLKDLRKRIEALIPVGKGQHRTLSSEVETLWGQNHAPALARILEKHPALEKAKRSPEKQLGTLGSGNHFVELCLDEKQRVWIMLHSGSRGMGNAIGSYFIDAAKRDMECHLAALPDANLAYLQEGSDLFADYVEAVAWAQNFARDNRAVMLAAVMMALREKFPDLSASMEAIDCHHNYVQQEQHFGEQLWVTRKGAVRAQKGEFGIIPGSMGAKSFIVQGLGHAQSFCSCSHGAGRVMSRTEAKKRISLKSHREALKNVECRKDGGVLDESPAAYKDIDAVMAAQEDLVMVVHTLKQVLCVKG